jgi:predicted metal-binding membrane protein
VLCALAWAYLLAGAGMGASAWEMTRLGLFPHRLAAAAPMAMDMPGMDMSGMAPPSAWSLGMWLLAVGMWWSMMVAMMAPTAAPAILLYGRVHAHAVTQGRAAAARLAPGWGFAAGYLAMWLAFAVAAASLQWGLQQTGLMEPRMMGSQSRWLSAGVLAAAGVYQLTPLQNACLSHCRSPTAFLTRHWRPGLVGALRLGALHGAYCVGCCWLLMALLFVGGVMNLVWIAALAALVLAEKLLPGGRRVATVSGVLLWIWGAATLVV